MTKHTEPEATDEAVRMFMRRLRRFDQRLYSEVLTSLGYSARGDGMREALAAAEQRADTLLATEPGYVEREWPSRFEDMNDDEPAEHDEAACSDLHGDCACVEHLAPYRVLHAKMRDEGIAPDFG
jgi:hypothetical protein